MLVLQRTLRYALLAVALAVTTVPASAQPQLTRQAFSSGVTNASGGSYTLRATIGQPVVGTVTGGTYVLCQGYQCGAGSGGPGLAVALWLQGAYDAGSGAMRTTLRDDSLIPLNQPYSAAAFDGTPLDYDGAETTTAQVLTDNPVVDWVLVELRATATGTPTARAAGLLQADGTVIGADGQPLSLAGAPASAFVVVRHRNHIAAMTATAVNLSTSVTLTASSGYGADGQTEVASGVWALWAGDGSLDGQVTAPDFNVYGASDPSGYLVGDYTLDGQATAPDFNVYSQNAAASASGAVPEN